MKNDNYFEYLREENESYYFDFKKIEDFELLKDLLINDLNAILIEMNNGPSEEIALFKKDGIEFELVFDFDYGNSVVLRNREKESIRYLRDIVEKLCDRCFSGD